MSAKNVSTANIQLDEHGRVVLDDDLLHSLSEHVLSPPLAGGANGACPNTGCSNFGCNSPLQVNTSCTNTSCENNNNTGCLNRYAGDDS